MTDTWNEYAHGWDNNPDVKAYADQAFASLCSVADMRDPGWATKRVLDFGSGTGLLAQKVAPYVGELIAVDTSETMIDVLQNKQIPNVRAVHGEILAPAPPSDVDLPSGFDLIYASSVCAFLPDYDGAVRALAGCLRSGGRFIQWDWQACDDDAFGLTEEQIRKALQTAQLDSLQVGHAFSTEADKQILHVLIGTGIA